MKKILIALVLVVGLQMMPGFFVADTPVVQAQGTAPEGSLESENFMFDLSSITHEGIEGSTRQGWIRRGINYFFERIIGFMATVIGSLAVLMMSIGGFRMIISRGGDEAQYTQGKQMVLYSLIGLGVTLMAYIMVSLVQLLIVSIYG